jgi:Ring hydroxylating alpha subunit (catalytic domain)
LAPDRTKFVTYTLTGRRREEDREDARRSAERDFAFVAQGAAEDRAVAPRVQRGLAGGANQTIEFGRFEGAIVHFHQQLTELLAV